MEKISSNGAQPFGFDAGGHAIAGLRQGAGPAVVIVHGLGGHKEDFAAVMDLLAARFTVYAFDMLGFGGSSRQSPAVGIEIQAALVEALLDAERLARAHVVGNSLGGWVAATFAARHPSRIGKLVLIDAAGLKVTLAGPPPVNFAPDTVEDMQLLLKTVIASPFAHAPDFAAQALTAFRAGGEAATLSKLFAGFVSPDNQDRLLDDVLPDVKCPTLVVWGEQDGLFPVALADVVMGGLPDARKVVIPNASHFPQIDSPSALGAALLDFL